MGPKTRSARREPRRLEHGQGADRPAGKDREEVDLVMKGRGTRVTDHMRATAEHKLGKIARLDHRVGRVEVEVIEEHNPRVGAEASHRVEISAETRRSTLRAQGSGQDIESALDQAVGRLERQMNTRRSKFLDRISGRKNRRKMPRTSPDGSSTSE